MIKKSIIFLILVLSIIFSVTNVPLVKAQEIYYPYPIIFVHGIDSSISRWAYTKNNLEMYFKNQNGYKYFYNTRQDYFPDCDYGFMNNGDIRSIAWVLKASIDDAIKGLPQDQKKVIIVAHSMGGLVVRSLLKQIPDYQSKINKVVFIGTPHLGAPAASALWILNELNESTIDDIVTKYSKFYSASAFTGFRFKPINYSPSVFSGITSRLITLKLNIVALLKSAKAIGPDPDGIALEELRLAGDVNYHTTIVDFSPFRYIVENISLGHSGSETFLGQNYLTNPASYKTIRGINSGWGIPEAWGMNFLIDNFSNNFTFPSNMSLDNARITGDGIVTMASQEGIGSSNYAISAFHTDEPDAYQTILQAIEDKPVIERIKVIAVDESKRAENMEYYIIVKLKEYLLADIEIVEMTLEDEEGNKKDIIPTEFKDNKPYYGYKDKAFLKERWDANAPVTDIEGNKTNLHLFPGEFYVKQTLTAGNVYTLRLKVKNPAEEIAHNGMFTDEVEAYVSRPIVKDLLFLNGKEGDWCPWGDKWKVDVPVYDEDWWEGAPDNLKNYGTLKEFTITDGLFKDMKINIWIYPSTWPTPAKVPLRKLVEDEPVTLDGIEGDYSKEFKEDPKVNVIWDGKDDDGNFVTEYHYYKIQILAKPLSDDPYIYPHKEPEPIIKQLLLGTNWDKYSGPSIILADPTFIQHSGEINLNFCSKDRQNNLSSRLDKYRLSQRQAFEGFNYELASHLKAIGASEEVIAKLENSTPSYKQNPSPLACTVP